MSFRCVSALTLALCLAPAFAAPLFAAPAVVITPGTAAQAVDVRLTDTTNSTWRLQTSTDLVDCHDRALFKVRNSDHTFQVDRSAARRARPGRCRRRGRVGAVPSRLASGENARRRQPAGRGFRRAGSR